MMTMRIKKLTTCFIVWGNSRSNPMPRKIFVINSGPKTFAQRNETFGRPRNPEFLLEPGELLEAVRGSLRVVAYEDGVIGEPRPAVVQRICAQRWVPGAAIPTVYPHG